MTKERELRSVSVAPQPSKQSIMKSLLKYMILAVENEVLPENFNLEKFLKLAKDTAYFELNPYPFRYVLSVDRKVSLKIKSRHLQKMSYFFY